MFQDFGAKALSEQNAESSAADAASQAAELVARYPNLSEIELAKLINLYRDLPALDFALMISDTRLASKLDQFFNDHRRQLRTPIRQYAVLLAIAAAGIAVALWGAMHGLM